MRLSSFVTLPASADATERLLRITSGILAFACALTYLIVVAARIALSSDLGRISGPMLSSPGALIVVIASVGLARTPSRLLAVGVLILVAANGALSFPAVVPLLMLLLAARAAQLAFARNRFHENEAPIQQVT
jgi:hypothetical protein